MKGTDVPEVYRCRLPTAKTPVSTKQSSVRYRASGFKLRSCGRSLWARPPADSGTGSPLTRNQRRIFGGCSGQTRRLLRQRINTFPCKVSFLYTVWKIQRFLYSAGRWRGGMDLESTACPIACKPLSTYRVTPLTARAKGDSRNSAAPPTSSLYKSLRRGALL